MQFQLDFQMPESASKLKHGDSIVLLGSCFSDNLAPKFENTGFKVCSNPLGTIFHPLALSNGIQSALGNFESKAVNRDDLWFDWRASGTIYGTNHASLNEKMQLALSELKQNLSEAKMLVVTFGTAWGYHLESGEVVANCHKMPSGLFDKKLTEVDELHKSWQETLSALKTVNRELKVVFTVSPVRHSKDGLIENNRSKARLIQLCELLSEHEDYFPSYELVIDVLRDHRFFESDLVHPNHQAIDFVWEQAQSFFFTEKTQKIAREVEALNRMRSHRSLHPESEGAKAFTESTVKKMEGLSKKHPGVWWND